MPSAPILDVAPDWKTQPRLWGHSFHPMCSYLGSNPAALVHAFIARYSRPGDVVFDPFCGRGTVPLQACAVGRVGVGNDLEPLAVRLTGAKVNAPTAREALDRLAVLRVDWTRESASWLDCALDGRAPAQVAALFHPATLAQLLFLRAALDSGERIDRFLLAATAGILHGRRHGYLTPAMPNGFSLAPGYVTRSVARQRDPVPERELFARLDAKVRRLYRDGRPAVRGVALGGDARTAAGRAVAVLAERSLPDRIRLVVSSPPYLATLRYGAQNWLRAWLIGDARAEDGLRPADVRPGHAAPDRHAELIRTTLRGLRSLLTDDAVVVLVLGDVLTQHGRKTPAPLRLADAVWRHAAEPEGYHLAGVVVDPVARHRKLTTLWGAEAGRTTDVDRLLVLGATERGRRRAIAASRLAVDWGWPPGHSSWRPATRPAVGILGRDAPDVPPGRSSRDGPARADEEPRPRPDDESPAQLHPSAAGSPVHAGGEPDPGRDRPVRGGRAPDRVGDGAPPIARLTLTRTG